MEQAQSKSQYILWIIAGLLVFAVITLLVIKVFYGLVVPQVQTISQLGVFIVLSFAFIAGVVVFLRPVRLLFFQPTLLIS